MNKAEHVFEKLAKVKKEDSHNTGRDLFPLAFGVGLGIIGHKFFSSRQVKNTKTLMAKSFVTPSGKIFLN